MRVLSAGPLMRDSETDCTIPPNRFTLFQKKATSWPHVGLDPLVYTMLKVADHGPEVRFWIEAGECSSK